jgi:hypothetical protein
MNGGYHTDALFGICTNSKCSLDDCDNATLSSEHFQGQ